MAIYKITKEKALSEDLDLGMGTSTGTRVGTQINASNIPYDATRSIAEELDTKESLESGDERYAFKAGNTNQVFNVQSPSNADEATPKKYVDDGLANKPSNDQVASALATKAEKAGSSSQAFNVFSPVFPALPGATETMNFTFMNAWFEGAIQPAINDKAEKATTLDTVVEHAAYAPSLPMHPATKKYVDEKVLDIGAGDMTVFEFVDPATATSGVHTTNNVGSFSSPLGISGGDQIMRLSQTPITDINAIAGFGIHVGAVDGMAGDLPPASAGTNLAVEQLSIDDGTLGVGELAAVVLVGQRATTDQGYFTRFGDGTTYGTWSKAATEADIGTYAYSKAEVDASQGTQDTAISANTAKVGITTAQADAITANTAKISYSDGTLVAQHTTDIATNATGISDLGTSKIGAANYASADGTVGGTCKARLDGTTMYITFDGSNA